MPEIPRLNSIIKALEEGKTVFVGFNPVDVESAIALAASAYDGIAFEMEHGPLNTPGLRDALQYMLGRRQILERGTLATVFESLVNERTLEYAFYSVPSSFLARLLGRLSLSTFTPPSAAARRSRSHSSRYPWVCPRKWGMT